MKTSKILAAVLLLALFSLPISLPAFYPELESIDSLLIQPVVSKFYQTAPLQQKIDGNTYRLHAKLWTNTIVLGENTNARGLKVYAAIYTNDGKPCASDLNITSIGIFNENFTRMLLKGKKDQIHLQTSISEAPDKLGKIVQFGPLAVTAYPNFTINPSGRKLNVVVRIEDKNGKKYLLKTQKIEVVDLDLE